jgi:hypothetical protein
MFTNSQHHLNQRLAALPAKELVRFVPDLDWVQLRVGLTIYEPGTPIQYVYFPISAIVSPLYEMDEGALVQVAVVGKEGMVGVALLEWLLPRVSS